MSVTAGDETVERSQVDLLLDMFAQLEELSGQRNAIEARIVEVIHQIDAQNLWGATGCRSLKHLTAWKLGMTDANAELVVAISDRYEEFPRCISEMQEGRLSLDQVGVIAQRGGEGSDDHYAELACEATVNQLRTALRMEVRPEPEKRYPKREFVKYTRDGYTTYKITVPTLEAAKVDAALDAHHVALINDHDRDEDTVPEGPNPEWPPHIATEAEVTEGRRPFPTLTDAFLSMVEAAWDAEAARRPHGAHTTVIVHLDPEKGAAWLHRGPLLSEADRQLLLCDCTGEVWLEKRGTVIGAGRATRTINRRLRRALEHRDQRCVVPGCSAQRGLQAHHIRHWEHGGETELHNLVLVCPFHHRAHHRGVITIEGTADNLVVRDTYSRRLARGSLARPPSEPPPDVPPWRGPSGEKADWWWYTPYEPPPPTAN
ncbi:IclR family transcriptional regulator [Mycolicibacterium phlei]|jgi:hypothetical protein|uniref:HNH nuclease domain-containing protein n=1 Tax=Mycolicibacterium phlei DSM 43239 = CCUG 21000 TaxID=1226750 RepID=A0A5N5VEU4_MYCPH|nr:HNH endonuclease signature motif containing protein [Mycolicibacterium phlei]VEG08007.1 IclR family transcriptional regulator [Mycobacteroides chelonae]AMO59881.1 hypothetical protein MPHLCCUG_01052 [Mycolicibacterium phlei]EID18184.1 hypothetical protein MPHLEI_00902 [Mycolicibacterium phlei RIVM601174]KAB7759327.1 hypothetical protein MPHL21000_03700 [Mycolicibacterium phlei DSM 43239 = CCUG 21000]KXW61031.1 hypothetical protein MPHL43070_06690 [Mycolicibacterium phlei DSM 43070]